HFIKTLMTLCYERVASLLLFGNMALELCGRAHSQGHGQSRGGSRRSRRLIVRSSRAMRRTANTSQFESRGGVNARERRAPPRLYRQPCGWNDHTLFRFDLVAEEDVLVANVEFTAGDHGMGPAIFVAAVGRIEASMFLVARRRSF